MKNTCVLLTVFILLTSCSKKQNEIDLLGDLSRWTGDEITSSGEEWLISGQYKTMVYQPGIFRTFHNFELITELKTSPGSAAGICFHTGKRDPELGYEVKIDNSRPGDWDHLLKTGSLSGIRNVAYNMVPDNEWFTLKIKVVENHVEIFVNDYPVVNYTEPEVPYRTTAYQKRMLNAGTFSIQTHYEHSDMYIRKMVVKPLPRTDISKNNDPEFTRKITMLHIRNIPVVDYHVHIKGDLTMEQALDLSARHGINYGIAANCGLKFPIQTDEELEAYLNSIEGLPIFKAMQAEGREWVDMFDPELIAGFDYAFTDAMTWTNRNGTRMRLWIPEETEVGDPEDFMDQLVEQIEQVVTEPISVYVNPTYLPAEIADRYDELWTEERVDRVIAALKKNHVALEINSKSKLPGKIFIEKGKAAGIKFAMGTNNGNAENLGRLEWAIEMINEFNLQASDMFLPGAISEDKQ